MNDFVLSGKARTFLFALMGLGVICLGLTWMNDDELHTRLWSNILHNSVFFTGIAFMAAFFFAICVTAYAGWHVLFKRIFEAIMGFLPWGLGIMTLIAVAVYMHMNHLYHWADTSLLDPSNPDTYDPILAGKAGFLNKNWYLFGTVIIVGIWTFFALKMRALSRKEDVDGQGDNFAVHRSIRKYAAIFLPIAGFSSAAIIWQWVMSIDAHWYSTMFAWYASASWFVSMIAMTIMILLFLKGNGYYEEVKADHVHDLGKFLFAFSIFWTYLWFSQYMLIWYANVGEETGYFKERADNYPVLFYGNLVINFLVPFFVLLRNDTKRKFGSVGLVAGLVFIGHWWDYFLMIKPGVLHTAHEAAGHGHGHGEAAHGAGDHGAHAAEHVSTFVSGFTLPGLLEVGTFLGFLGLFLFVVLTALTKAPLVAKNDPYLEESVHHHVV